MARDVLLLLLYPAIIVAGLASAIWAIATGRADEAYAAHFPRPVEEV